MFESNLDIFQELNIDGQNMDDPERDNGSDFSDAENQNDQPENDTNSTEPEDDDPHEETPDFEEEPENDDNTGEDEPTDDNVPEDDGTDDNLELQDDDPHEETPDFGGEDGSEDDNTDDTADTSDTTNDDGTEDDQSNVDTEDPGGVTDDELKELEDKVFSDLSDKDKDIRVLELKGLFNKLYLCCDNINEKINDVIKTEDNIPIFKRITDTLEKSKEYIKYYIENKFDNVTYSENSVVFNTYLSILSGIKNVLNELNIKNSPK